MTAKKNQWDDPEESKRFLDEAKAAEASDDPKDFDDVLKKVTKRGSRV
jgi:hypothetical protein